jgi:hypothetical protein
MVECVDLEKTSLLALGRRALADNPQPGCAGMQRLDGTPNFRSSGETDRREIAWSARLPGRVCKGDIFVV